MFHLLCVELAELAGDVLKIFGVFPILDLCEDFISSFLSLIELRGDLSEALIDFLVDC